jgi:hypothetical protein
MSYHREKIKTWYDEAVRLSPKIESDLRAALKSHERVPLFISNLEKEFDKVQADRIKKGKPKFQESTLKGFVYDMVDVFAMLAKKAKDEAHASEITKILAERKRQELKDMESTEAGKPQGIYSEIEMTYLKERNSDGTNKKQGRAPKGKN